MNGCRQCLIRQHDIIAAEAEVRRLARILARTTRPANLARYKDELVIAKMKRAEAREQIEQGHECDNDLSDKHWTKSRA
jgi:hypothetical protein